MHYFGVSNYVCLGKKKNSKKISTLGVRFLIVIVCMQFECAIFITALRATNTENNNKSSMYTTHTHTHSTLLYRTVQSYSKWNNYMDHIL